MPDLFSPSVSPCLELLAPTSCFCVCSLVVMSLTLTWSWFGCVFVFVFPCLQCLLTLLDSPLNKAGHLKIFIHTTKVKQQQHRPSSPPRARRACPCPCPVPGLAFGPPLFGRL